MIVIAINSLAFDTDGKERDYARDDSTVENIGYFPPDNKLLEAFVKSRYPKAFFVIVIKTKKHKNRPRAADLKSSGNTRTTITPNARGFLP